MRLRQTKSLTGGQYFAIVVSVCAGIGAVGCSAATEKNPTYVEVTQLAPYVHAAKPPDCAMPVLASAPQQHFQQVAIVEAWGDVTDTPADVLPDLRRGACGTGADALLIINSKHQDIRNLLSGVTPNETQDDLEAKQGYQDSESYMRTMEHTRRIGEAGHNGLYVDGVAINYITSGQKDSGSDPSPGS